MVAILTERQKKHVQQYLKLGYKIIWPGGEKPPEDAIIKLVYYNEDNKKVMLGLAHLNIFRETEYWVTEDKVVLSDIIPLAWKLHEEPNTEGVPDE